MLVSHNTELKPLVAAHKEISQPLFAHAVLFSKYTVPAINHRAIFYAHAAPSTELINPKDFVDDNAVMTFWESKDD